MANDKIDFDDEDAVLEEVCQDLGESAEEIEDAEISEERGFTSFGEGTVYLVKVSGREYAVAEDQDAAHELAVAVVTQDLEEEPEIFEKSFISGHIDKKKLARELRSDIESERRDYYDDLAETEPERFWREAEAYGVEKPEAEDDEDEDDVPDPSDDDIEQVVDKSTDELIADPMSYLEDIYGDDEAVDKAIEIAGIDVEAAAEEAVQVDGEGHFLSHYDSETHETKHGLVYWRMQ